MAYRRSGFGWLPVVFALAALGAGEGDTRLADAARVGDIAAVDDLLKSGAWGQLKGGRHLKLEEETPMANLLVSILEKTGLEVESVGDSTGRLTEL